MPTVTSGADTSGMKKEERHRCNGTEKNSLQSLCGVTCIVREGSEEVRRRPGVREYLSERVRQKAF